MPVQVQVTITSPGDSLADLINQLKTALAPTGLVVAPESLVEALEAALAECEKNSDASVASIQELTATVKNLKAETDSIDKHP